MDIKALAGITGSEVIETHISWVLLGEFVYKIKKPVKFSFLDFSTPEKRRFYCSEEVRLNSRLSPDVYLGVAGVGENGFVAPEGSEEHAVKMRRLSEARKMSSLLAHSALGPEHMAELAKIVADFHMKAQRAPEYNTPELIGAQVADLGNFREGIEGATGLGRWVDNLLKRSEDFLKRNRELIEGRRRGGFVRDCHGDLHSGNVFFDSGIRIIDCIEFSESFRCTDVASDVGFMAMDLEYAGREDLSEAFVGEYLRATGDEGMEAVLPFYKCYRANVRAKIAAIDYLGGKSAEARTRIDRYVMLAEKYSKTMA
ncbi:MAG TPA: phosphotransferase [Candidatus Bilamarchaeum sp.]|nr:phosphotransferase [Candidatus Bilamarchaeum sp.]